MSAIWGPFFWGVMTAALMELCAHDHVRSYIRWPIRIFIYCACAFAVDRFFLVIPL